MYSYSMVQWLFFFYIYCFAGWCIESGYVSVKERKLTNRGFMRGPFLPLYGSGAIMMLVVSMPFQDHIVLTYLAGCVGATVLEYVTGVTMEALFKIRYWDYSNNRFNFQGHVCLGTSLAWGFLTILMTEVVHVPVEKFGLSIPNQLLTVLTFIMTVGIAADFALSFKAAIDIRNVLVKMEQVKREMVHLQKRLDVVIALAGREVTNHRAALAEGMNSAVEEWTGGMTERIEDVKSGIESKLETAKNMVLSRPAEYWEGIKEELLDLKTKYAVYVADRNRLGKIRDFFQKDMIRSNPHMTSRKYREAFEEIRREMAAKKDAEQDTKAEQDVKAERGAGAGQDVKAEHSAGAGQDAKAEHGAGAGQDVKAEHGAGTGQNVQTKQDRKTE